MFFPEGQVRIFVYGESVNMRQLKTIFELQFESVSLVFCGGTSLSKSHGLIERMSEDADLKVVLS